MTAQDSWRKTLLPTDATLKHAIRSLNDSALQIVVIVAEDDTLIGTITDGDIRRGLLRGLELSSSVEAVVNRAPLVAPLEVSRSTALQLMQANRLHQLPIVNAQQQVVGLHVWDEIVQPQPRANLMVIMAGGKGTRLRPITENCPKPLLPVAGKPMLEHIIERAHAGGFSRFVLAVHYLGHQIEEFCGDGSRWHVNISYLREESPLGTAGAIALLKPAPQEPFLVTNGDVLTDIHYDELLDFHLRHGAAATMAIRPHEWQHPLGVVHTSGVDIVGFEEKPIVRSNINAGIYVLAPVALEHLNAGEHCDMPTLFTRLREHGQRTIVYPIHEAWIDIGRPEDYVEANHIES